MQPRWSQPVAKHVASLQSCSLTKSAQCKSVDLSHRSWELPSRVHVNAAKLRRTVHSDEWDDGMPPESTKAVRSQTPVL